MTEETGLTPSAAIYFYDDPDSPANYLIDFRFRDVNGDNISTMSQLMAAAIIELLKTETASAILDVFVASLPEKFAAMEAAEEEAAKKIIDDLAERIGIAR